MLKNVLMGDPSLPSPTVCSNLIIPDERLHMLSYQLCSCPQQTSTDEAAEESDDRLGIAKEDLPSLSSGELAVCA